MLGLNIFSLYVDVNDVGFILLKYWFDLETCCVLKAAWSYIRGLQMGLNILHSNSWGIATNFHW